MFKSNAFCNGLIFEGRWNRIQYLQGGAKCFKTAEKSAIELREKGFGKHKNKSDPLTSDEELLWKLKVLRSNNSKPHNYTVFYLISQQFGTRGCQEHHQLQVEELKFVHDPFGKTMHVEWVKG